MEGVTVSRRRKPTNRDVVETVVPVVCTDKGTHRRRQLGRVTLWPDDVVECEVQGERGGFLAAEDVADIHMTRTFRCPDCGRDVPLRDSTIESVARTLIAARVGTLDVSYARDML